MRNETDSESDSSTFSASEVESIPGCLYVHKWHLQQSCLGALWLLLRKYQSFLQIYCNRLDGAYKQLGKETESYPTFQQCWSHRHPLIREQSIPFLEQASITASLSQDLSQSLLTWLH